MYTVTRIMMSFTSLVTTFLCLMSFTACKSEPVVPVRYDVVFKLPGYTREFVNEAWVDIKNGGHAKIDVGGNRKGTDANARSDAEDRASRVCGIEEEVVERKVDGRPIYIVRDGCVIYTNAAPIDTIIFFEKEGWVVHVVLLDDYYDHEEEIAELVRTLRWVPQKNTNNEN